jgi:hypothetical protein
VSSVLDRRRSEADTEAMRPETGAVEREERGPAGGEPVFDDQRDEGGDGAAFLAGGAAHVLIEGAGEAEVAGDDGGRHRRVTSQPSTVRPKTA